MAADVAEGAAAKGMKAPRGGYGGTGGGAAGPPVSKEALALAGRKKLDEFRRKKASEKLAAAKKKQAAAVSATSSSTSNNGEALPPSLNAFTVPSEQTSPSTSEPPLLTAVPPSSGILSAEASALSVQSSGDISSLKSEEIASIDASLLLSAEVEKDGSLEDAGVHSSISTPPLPLPDIPPSSLVLERSVGSTLSEAKVIPKDDIIISEDDVRTPASPVESAVPFKNDISISTSPLEIRISPSDISISAAMRSSKSDFSTSTPSSVRLVEKPRVEFPVGLSDMAVNSRGEAVKSSEAEAVNGLLKAPSMQKLPSVRLIEKPPIASPFKQSDMPSIKKETGKSTEDLAMNALLETPSMQQEETAMNPKRLSQFQPSISSPEARTSAMFPPLPSARLVEKPPIASPFQPSSMPFNKRETRKSFEETGLNGLLKPQSMQQEEASMPLKKAPHFQSSIPSPDTAISAISTALPSARSIDKPPAISPFQRLDIPFKPKETGKSSEEPVVNKLLKAPYTQQEEASLTLKKPSHFQSSISSSEASISAISNPSPSSRLVEKPSMLFPFQKSDLAVNDRREAAKSYEGARVNGYLKGSGRQQEEESLPMTRPPPPWLSRPVHSPSRPPSLAPLSAPLPFLSASSLSKPQPLGDDLKGADEFRRTEADRKRGDFTYSSAVNDFAALEQHIEDLTKEKFTLKQGLDAACVLAESLAKENNVLMDDYNSQGATVNQLKQEIERLEKEIQAQKVVLASSRAERERAMDEKSSAVERSQALASEVIGLEEKVLRMRSQELKLKQTAERLTSDMEAQKRTLGSLEKDRTNLRAQIASLQEEKGSLQTRLRKAAVGGALRDVGASSSSHEPRGGVEAATSTEDLEPPPSSANSRIPEAERGAEVGEGESSEAREGPVSEGGRESRDSDAAQAAVRGSLDAGEATREEERLEERGAEEEEEDEEEEEEEEYMGVTANSSIKRVTSAMAAAFAAASYTTGAAIQPSLIPLLPDASEDLPGEERQTIQAIDDLLDEMREERRAMVRALNAEAAAAAELRASNADLSRKLAMQTQRLELAVAQNMRAASLSLSLNESSTLGSARFGQEYIDESDEVAERVLTWILRLFPGGRSNSKQ